MQSSSDISFAGISPAAALSIGIAALIAFAIHWAVFFVAQRIIRRTRVETDDIILCAIRGPTRWLVVLIAVGAGMESLTLGLRLGVLWDIGSKMIFALLLGWLALSFMKALRQVIEARSDITAEDNLKARQRHTRVRILYRIAQFLIALFVIALMLMAIPGVRTVGVTLMASAGLAGLAVGAAAQPALKNLIAGIQMAFTEPIRLDDVVIVEGEWGRIEDIRLTYVIVRLWDDRRLVVPVSWFLEKPFQNWTLQTSDLIGNVLFYVDPSADVGRIRDAFVTAVKANARWDGRVAVLQTTSHKPDALELRGLYSARNAGLSFDLGCDVREAVLEFLRTQMPEALPRGRQMVEGLAPTRPSDAAA